MKLYGPSRLQATPSTDQGYSHDQEKCIDQQDEGPALRPGRPHIATGSVQNQEGATIRSGHPPHEIVCETVHSPQSAAAPTS